MNKKMFESICTLIENERKRQDEIHGSNRRYSPSMWLAIMTEEVGEVASEVQEMYKSRMPVLNYATELIQVAATAVAALEEFFNECSVPGYDELTKTLEDK